jgi:large subunit ribosomal protein L23
MTSKNSYDILKALLRTEKATSLEPFRKYLFLVDKGANKAEIKNAVENVYKVKVAAVNTRISAGKLRRVRYQPGYAPDRKKAFVTLKEGNKIDIT